MKNLLNVTFYVILLVLFSGLMNSVSANPWVIETADSGGPGGDVGGYTDIALDSSGNAHISYYDWGNFYLMYATNASGSWVPETVDTSSDFDGATSIAIDSSNNVHISYYDWNNGYLMYATNASGSWITETVDASSDVGLDSSIALDSSDKVHISYFDWVNGDLRYATNSGVTPGSGNCTSLNWDCETVDIGDECPGCWGTGQFTSIALDSSNKVHISYYDWDIGNLWYATNSGVMPGSGNCTSSNWDCEEVDISADFLGTTSIAIDSSDKAHISYYDLDDGNLMYATNASGSWVPATVDSGSAGGDVGDYSGIAIDSSDNVHISYYDSNEDNEDLKYATNASGSWISEPVDTSGDVGSYSSIAIDSSDNAHISYYYLIDRTHGNLKYATNATNASIKESAISALEQLLSEDPDDDLIQARGYINMSLGRDDEIAGLSGTEVVWAEDGVHIDVCHGGYKGVDVFQYEQEACDKLDAYEENDENAQFDTADEIEKIRQKLAEADRNLAEVAIADAEANDGKADDIKEAKKLFKEGKEAQEKGGNEICDVALDKYEEAWEKAVKSYCEEE